MANFHPFGRSEIRRGEFAVVNSPWRFMKTAKNTGRPIKPKTLAASVGVIIFLTILARPFGIFREVLTAVYFGTRAELDAFLLASSIPLFLCTIFGGGLVQAIVPGLADAAEVKEKTGWGLLTHLAGMALLVGITLAIVNLIFAPGIVRFLFPPNATPSELRVGINVYRLLSLAIVGGILSGLFVGAANTFHFYGHTTLRSVAYNLMILGSLFFLHKRLGIYSLGVGILLAEYSQLFVVVPPLWARGFRPQMPSAYIRRQVRMVIWAFFPAVLLSGMGQVNYLVDRILAMPLGEGCVSSLHYAWKLILLPVGLLSVAFATPLLTFLSRHEARNERKVAGNLFKRTLGMLWFFAIPATFLLLLTRREVVSLFYAWGHFGHTGIDLTSSALFFYSPGLPFQLLLPLFVAGFLAIKKPWLPVFVSLPLVGVNWLLDRWLMHYFSHAGIALSTSLVFFINACVLYALLRRNFIPRERTKPLGRQPLFFLSVAIFFLVLWLIYGLRLHFTSQGRWTTLIELLIITLMTFAGYLLLAHIFNIPIIEDVLRQKSGGGEDAER